ncbi:MAG: hypothetical protein JO330_05580 [Mycobacteriaceae bacterium]|nr:hypothetical protein [Mycobacteriaceae bacterium]
MTRRKHLALWAPPAWDLDRWVRECRGRQGRRRRGASYNAGVLTVRVAGAYAGSQPKRIEITG